MDFPGVVLDCAGRFRVAVKGVFRGVFREAGENVVRNQKATENHQANPSLTSIPPPSQPGNSVCNVTKGNQQSLVIPDKSLPI